MEWILIGAVVLFFVWRMMPAKGVRNISADELKAMKKTKDSQWIDVRTPGEFKARNMRGFDNIPLGSLPNQTSKLDPEKETIVLCQSGMRSAQAAKILKKKGFKNVANVRGGMNQL
ncbi:rhodanese-like domain-containing protein [Jeotgalibacillus haloalkalitolerans]|uniref:Rhodanese-like domain-containing protein n=1 Tax=Jeotgalibacillus haloalkalitolerans TaxID=3104292 RepID=A0ABU5KPY5_9BACL|nr:rhodanese-like domain-containing protein [Jeotgalibacillus sp. HH7-29]MDZ5713219.1 rhodanese-like domain-containing protein [Jeotgalibacillus sp. HH7-29]